MKRSEEMAVTIAMAIAPIIEPALRRRLDEAKRAAMRAARPAPAKAKPKPAAKPVSRDALVSAAEEVAAAVDRLEQSRFSPAEGPARAALEERALALRAVLRRAK